jgi:hypothetical protein
LIIIHTPEGGAEERLDAGRLRASEIQIVERTADRPWAQIKLGLGDGEINALRVVGWIVKKRAQPTLRFAEFDPWEGEIRSRLDARETRAYAEAFVQKFATDPEQLAAAFDELRDSAAEPEVCEQIIADVTAPKDPAPPEPAAEPEQPPEASPASPSDG